VDKVNLAQKLSAFDELWSPGIGNVRNQRTVAEPQRI
jgi:hypothetical protein